MWQQTLPLLKKPRALCNQPLPKGRIEKHQVEPVFIMAQPFQRFRYLGADGRAGTQDFDSAPDLRKQYRAMFNQNGVGSAAGYCFQSQNPGARVKVKAVGAADDRLQPVEEGFPHPVRRRPQACDSRYRQFAPAPFAADDTDPAGTRRQFGCS